MASSVSSARVGAAGEQLTADWLKKAGADGQAVVEAYKKSIGTN